MRMERWYLLAEVDEDGHPDGATIEFYGTDLDGAVAELDRRNTAGRRLRVFTMLAVNENTHWCWSIRDPENRKRPPYPGRSKETARSNLPPGWELVRCRRGGYEWDVVPAEEPPVPHASLSFADQVAGELMSNDPLLPILPDAAVGEEWAVRTTRSQVDPPGVAYSRTFASPDGAEAHQANLAALVHDVRAVSTDVVRRTAITCRDGSQITGPWQTEAEAGL